MRLLSIIVLILCTLLFGGQTVKAGESEDVSIHARPYIAGAPVGFTLTYITDTNILIEWTKGDGADNTMIRAKFGEYPQDINDGYLVYEGSGETCNDTALNLDETASNIYYRAWSQSGGLWAEYDYSEGYMEPIAMMLIFLGLMALTPTIMAYVLKRSSVAIIGLLFWIILSVYAYTRIDLQGDVYWGIFIGAFFMGVMSIFEALLINRQNKPVAEAQPFFDYDMGIDAETRRMHEEKKERQRLKRERQELLGRRPYTRERQEQVAQAKADRHLARRNASIQRAQRRHLA